MNLGLMTFIANTLMCKEIQQQQQHLELSTDPDYEILESTASIRRR